jgi:outer membrane protein assembly factor BamB
MNKIYALILAVIFGLVGCKDSNQPLWKLTLKSRSYTEPIIQGDHFFVFSQAGEVICGNVRNGTRIWSQVVSGPVLGTPALGKDQTLFLITQNGALFSIDAKTGTTRWSVLIPDTFIAPVTLFGSIVLLPSEGGTIYARSASDGSEVWKFSGAGKFNSRAVISGNHVLIGGWAKDFYCLNPDGSVNWKFTAASRITEEAIVRENNVFFPSHDNYVYALEIPSGRLVWRHPADEPSNLAFWNDEILFASGNDLVSISALSGNVVGHHPFGKTIDRLYAYPPDCLVLSGRVYKVSSDLREADGFIRAPRPIFNLSIGGGMILASDDLYSIYGFATSKH